MMAMPGNLSNLRRIARFWKRGNLALLAAIVLANSISQAMAAGEVMPKHITADTLKAVRAGLEYLAKAQGDDGSWSGDDGGRAYPVAITALAGTALLTNGNTPTRGRYAPAVEKATEYLLTCSTGTGLITGPTQDNNMPMHGHGFALMYLALVYGSETKPALRQRTKAAIDKASLSVVGRSSTVITNRSSIPRSASRFLNPTPANRRSSRRNPTVSTSSSTSNSCRTARKIPVSPNPCSTGHPAWSTA